jgi:hypothetical protein
LRLPEHVVLVPGTKKKVFVTYFLLFCLSSLFLAPLLGRDFFPDVDEGQSSPSSVAAAYAVPHISAQMQLASRINSFTPIGARYSRKGNSGRVR